MDFDHLPSSHEYYLNQVFKIIRQGIIFEKNNFRKRDSENIKNQQLADRFNIIGTKDETIWIGVGKENEKTTKRSREDIYFYLDDDNKTRIFFIEGKRLPKPNSIIDEEYVTGISSTGKPSGGIERFKLGIHGHPDYMNFYGMIAYVENQSFNYWLREINKKINLHSPDDSTLRESIIKDYDFSSTHKLIGFDKNFQICHFWIRIT